MTEGPPSELVGHDVVGFRDERIGKIDRLYTHGDVTTPNWARVKAGVLGIGSVLVPLHDAELEGGTVRLFYEKEHVKTAPSAEPDGDRISDEDAVLLHRHYGLEPVAAAARDVDDETELPREPREANPPGMDRAPRTRSRVGGASARELGVTREDRSTA